MTRVNCLLQLLGGDTEKDGIHNDVYGNRLENNNGGAFKIVRYPQGKICGNTKASSDVWSKAKLENIDPGAICSN